MIESKLKAKNCNRGQLFRPYWVSSVRRSKLVCVVVLLSGQRHDILDFCYCPLSRVLHVTLANWQEFGFEFHLRSSPSYSEYMDISQIADYFI